MMRTAGTGRTRTLAASLVLLGLFAGMAPCQRTVAPIDQRQYLQIEPVELGLGVPAATLRLLKVTWHSGHGLRAGISALDWNGTISLQDLDSPGGLSIAPIHIGYDIVFNPRKTAFFYGMVPSCYAEATFGAFPAYAKLAAAYDIDYYGIGAGFEVGVVDWNNVRPWPGFHPQLYAALKLRLLDAAFRLPGRR
jgi:hypothetical protein